MLQSDEQNPTFGTHDTIVLGFESGKIKFCRTFNHQTQREDMLKAYDHVSSKYEKYSMGDITLISFNHIDENGEEY